jgi:hypothetical protein
VTSPAPSGGSSPLRIGGLALIGVGAVAGLIGVASLIGGGTSSATEAAPATTTVAPAPETPAPAVPAPAPTSAAAAPTTSADGAVPVPSFSATPTAAAPRTTTAPTTTAPKVAKSALRVYNNSTITGLAARAAADFRASGWPVDAVANYPQGVIPSTTVYYRPGTAEQASAESLAAAFGMRSEARFQGLDEATPGLIVIVTNDFKGK